MPRHAFACLIGSLLLSLSATATAADVRGSSDHPLVSRFQGSEITAHRSSEFDGFPLLVRKVTRYGGLDKNRDAVENLEGRITRLTYRAPEGRTPLEVFRNYQSALQGAGFQVLFACGGEECGGRNFNHAVSPRHAYTPFGEYHKDQRYLAAHLKREAGDAYVAVYTVASAKGRVFTQLDVVEVQAMEVDMVKVDADAMAKGLEAEGHIALYNLYFDSGKAVLKPESGPELAEIARLLQSQPQLKLLVVGHTDNVGELAFNEDLSRRRAQAVVQALVREHGIAAARLHPAGVGMYAPVASNAAEAGRAKNRRVELVKR